MKGEIMETEKITFKKIRNWLLFSILIVAIILISSYLLSTNDSKVSNINLGYMTFWAEGAFPAQALQNTLITENNNLNISYIKVQYGPPLVEAALSKKVDVIFTGWVPAVNLMTKSDDWIVVGKLTYFPMELMARTGSDILKVEDLRGKKLGLAYGSGPYPVVMMSLKEHGLVPGKDVEIINIKPADMGVALQSERVDAIAAPEPQMSLFKEQNLAYPIEEYKDIGFIVLSKSYATKNPEEVKHFLTAVKESFLYISENKNQVYNWFSQESQYDLKLVNSLKIIEPNFNAKSLDDVSLEISDEWISATQQKIDFEFEEKIIDTKVNLAEKINLNYLDN
jgi:ABC-type nitrate/sulfonate/bicarbonate transport system substrate-binding protein